MHLISKSLRLALAATLLTSASPVLAAITCERPLAFDFTPQANVGANATVLSNSVLVQTAGCAAPISISGGEYSINGGPFTAAPGSVSSGQSLRLRVHTSSSVPQTSPYPSTIASIIIGGYHTSFNVWNGAVQQPCSGATCTSPAALTANGWTTVLYKGKLANSSQLKLRAAFNNWSSKVPDIPMTRDPLTGYWSANLRLPACAQQLDYALTDGSLWDNNGGKDWHVPVAGGSGACTGSITLSFRTRAVVNVGEALWITGNTFELGNWSTVPTQNRQCDATHYPDWDCTVAFGSGNQWIEYKFVRLGAVTTWESGANRKMLLPAVDAFKHDGNFRQ